MDSGPRAVNVLLPPGSRQVYQRSPQHEDFEVLQVQGSFLVIGRISNISAGVAKYLISANKCVAIDGEFLRGSVAERERINFPSYLNDIILTQSSCFESSDKNIYDVSAQQTALDYSLKKVPVMKKKPAATTRSVKNSLSQVVTTNFKQRAADEDVAHSKTIDSGQQLITNLTVQSNLSSRHEQNQCPNPPCTCVVRNEDAAQKSSVPRFHEKTCTPEKSLVPRPTTYVKAFAGKSSLSSHKTTRNGVKPHACGTCTSSFYYKSHLRRHELSHNSRKPYTYECAICNARFAHISKLRFHEIHHTGDKPHSDGVSNNA